MEEIIKNLAKLLAWYIRLRVVVLMVSAVLLAWCVRLRAVILMFSAVLLAWCMSLRVVMLVSELAFFFWFLLSAAEFRAHSVTDGAGSHPETCASSALGQRVV